MAVGKQGSASVTVTLDDSGGTPRAITNHVLEMGGTKITTALEASHAFGDAWEEATPSGVSKVDDITLGGFFDTTATTGPHVVMNPASGDSDPNGATRTLTVVFGDSKTLAGEARLMSYELVGSVGNLTKFSCVLRPTGTWTLT